MNALVGYTGFVGSNLYTPERFGAAWNSKNIEEAYGTKPDLLVYAGVRAEKFLANKDPEKDLLNIRGAMRNMEKINPRKLVLISTVDVFKKPVGADEDFPVETEGLHPYGANRYLLEQWVRDFRPDTLIVRLPALFGKRLKKNFIYDYLHVIPSMLKEEKFGELAEKDPRLQTYYIPQGNGFYKAAVPEEKREEVKAIFADLGFSALNFTDSRSTFQFYGLNRLWTDLQTALEKDLRLLHTATESVTAGEVYRFLTGREFINELDGIPARYDFRTKYAVLFGREGGYLLSREEVLKEIQEFANGELDKV